MEIDPKYFKDDPKPEPTPSPSPPPSPAPAGGKYSAAIEAAGEAPAAPGPSKYADAIEQVGSARTVALKSSLAAAAETDADRQAKVIALAEKTKLPTSVVERNLDLVDARTRLAAVDYDQLASRHPELSTWLSNRDNAAIAQDDIGVLRHLDLALRAVTKPKDDITGILPEGFLFDGNQIIEPVQGSPGYAKAYKDLDELRTELDRRGDRAGVAQLQREQGAKDLERELGAFANFAVGMGTSLDATRRLLGTDTADSRAATEAAEEASQTLSPGVWGDLQRGAGGLAADIPLMIAGGPIAGTAGSLLKVSRARALLAPIVGKTAAKYGAGAIKTAAAVQPLAIREGVTTAQDHGAGNGALAWLIETAIPGAFGRTGVERVLVGGVERATAAKTWGDVAKTVLKHAGLEKVEEVTTEFGHALHEAASGIDPDALQPEKLWRRLFVAGVLGGVAGGIFNIPHAMAEKFHGDAVAADEAQRYAQRMATAAAMMKDSKLAERSPERLAQLTEALIGDGERNTFFQRQDWDAHWEAAGEDPDEMALMVGAQEAYREARATGGVMAVRNARLLPFVASTEGAAPLLKKARQAPSAKSQEEAEAFTKDAPDQLAELAKQAQEAAPADPKADPIFQDVVKQRMETGADQAAAEREAQTVSAFFTTMATRWNAGAEERGVKPITPAELYDRYQLKIRRQLPAALRAGSVDVLDTMLDRLRSGDVPGQKEIFGASLMEFLGDRGLVDDQGDLAAMDIDAGRKPFQRKMLREGGRTLDDAAERAAEAGYISERSIPKLMEAIREELAGRPTYREGQENPGKAALKEELDQLQEALDALGIDLATNTDNAAIKRALEGQQDPEQQKEAAQTTLNQPAFHGSPHQFDKFTTDHMGTGEGVQAYGWGLYFAGSKKVAQWYREKLGRRNMKVDGVPVAGGANAPAMVNARLVYNLGSVDAAITHVTSPEVKESWRVDGLEALRGKKVEPSGRVYQVDIPEDGEFLLWDKPLSEQPAHVQKTIIALLKADGDSQYLAAVQAYDAGNHKALKEAGFNVFDYPGTAGAIYQRMAELSSPKSASMALLKAGVKGTKYLDQMSRADGDGTYNYVIYDGADVAITEYEQGGDAEAKGLIRFGKDRKFAIELLAGADLSTFLHETGHFYLEVLGDLAQDAGAPEQIRKDYQQLLDWFGVKTRDDIKTEHHEQFARGFEAYLMEGKAPSAPLRGTFARIKAWLVDVYKQLKNLRVTLTPEVRGVMDRLLATDEAISAAQYELGPGPTLTRADFDSDEAYTGYLKAVADARQAGYDRLQQELLDEFRAEQSQRYRIEREQVRTDVAAEVNKRPVYIAISTLMDGELPDGTRLPDEMQGLKLNKASLIQDFGEASLKRLPGPGAGKENRGRTIYSPEGGMDVNAAAELFGFRSGDEFWKAIVNAPNRVKVIEAETDAKMRERHPDPMTDGSLAERATAALHDDQRAKLLMVEISKLGQRIGQKPAPVELLRATARRTIDRRKVRDLRPDLYRMAEAKAARAALAAVAKDDYHTAYQEKQRELLNSELYRAARDAKEAAQASRTYMATFDRPGTRESIGKAGGWEWTVTFPNGSSKVVDTERAARDLANPKLGAPAGTKFERTSGYLDQIDSFLDRFEFRRVSLRQLRRRQSLVAWIAKQHAENAPVIIPTELQDETLRTNWQDLSVEQLRDVTDSVKNIEALARLKNEMLADAQKRKLDESLDQAGRSIVENSKGPRKVGLQEKTLERAKDNVGGFFAAHRKMASLVRVMDGNQDGGVLWGLFQRPINKAADDEASMREAATLALDKLFKAWGKSLARDAFTRRHIPEINDSLSRMGTIMVALNWGNADNRQRLMEGYGWTEDQVAAVLDRLDKADWTLVQGILNHIDSYWSEIKAKEQRVTGVAPEKVEALPIVTKFGTFAGGYFPIKYDPRQNPKARKFDPMEQAKAGATARATTRRGHIKAREESTGMKLLLDPRVIFGHINQVIHDLTHHEMLIDVGRLIANKELADTIMAHHGANAFDQLVATVDDVAAGDVGAQNTVERAVGWIRSGASIAAMGFNLLSAAQQVTGLGQSLIRVGPKFFGKAMIRIFRDAAHMEMTNTWVNKTSEFMRLRGKTQMRELNEIANRIGLSAARGPIDRGAYYLMAKMQRMVDLPTWVGAYEKAMEAGEDEKSAVAIADQTVIDTQGSGMVKDLSAIQRGGPWQKLWTTFYSYFNTTFNLTAESVAAFKQAGGIRSPSGMVKLAVDLLLLYSFPVIVGDLLRRALRGGDDEKPEEYVKRISIEHLGFLLGTLVLGREISSAVTNSMGYGGPAGARGFDALGDVIREVKQGEADAGAVKAAIAAAGILFHLPSLQVQRIIDGYAYSQEHRTNPVTPLLFGAPPKPR